MIYIQKMPTNEELAKKRKAKPKPLPKTPPKPIVELTEAQIKSYGDELLQIKAARDSLRKRSTTIRKKLRNSGRSPDDLIAEAENRRRRR